MANAPKRKSRRAANAISTETAERSSREDAERRGRTQTTTDRGAASTLNTIPDDTDESWWHKMGILVCGVSSQGYYLSLPCTSQIVQSRKEPSAKSQAQVHRLAAMDADMWASLLRIEEEFMKYGHCCPWLPLEDDMIMDNAHQYRRRFKAIESRSITPRRALTAPAKSPAIASDMLRGTGLCRDVGDVFFMDL